MVTLQTTWMALRSETPATLLFLMAGGFPWLKVPAS